MDVAQLVVTTLVALIGLYLANSYRRQQHLRVAERRLDAYGKLWELLEVARPTRVKDRSVDRDGPLRRQEAEDLYKQMTHWYFGSGNGLLLPDATKALYLEVKARLGAYAVEGDAPSDEGGTLRIEELGLLRAQMRLDLDIYSVSYLSTPDLDTTHRGAHDQDRRRRTNELLREARIDPEGWGVPPWRIRLAPFSA